MKDDGHDILHLHVAQQLSPIALSSWISDLSPTNGQ